MRSKWSFRVVALATAFTLFGSTAVMAEPGYYPSGPQTNVSISSLSSGGWTRCYSETMSVILAPLETLKSQCSGDYVLFAGGLAADIGNYLLVAAGKRQVVFNTTTLPQGVTTLNATYESNGTYWYAQDNLSVGFSLNPTVHLNKADVQSLNDPLRLSLHGSDAGFGYEGGYRIGAINGLWFSTDYIKAIWVSNGAAPVSMPLTTVGAPKASLDNKVMTCSSGSYKVGMSEVNVNSLRYHLYVNDELMSTVVYDKGANIQDSLKRNLPNKVSALVSEKDALFDLSGMNSFSAHCVVEAYGYGSAVSSFTSVIHDSAYYAAIKAKAEAEEAARQAALVEFNSKENRELRKRLAARGIRG